MKVNKLFAILLMTATVVVACGKNNPENRGESKKEISKVDFLLPGDGFEFMGENASDNKRYVAGSDFVNSCPAIWNVEKNETLTFPEYPEGTFHAVSDNGIAVGEATYAIAYINGSMVELYADKGELVEDEWGTFYNGESGSAAYDISADADLIAGFYFDTNWITTPCIWLSNGSTRVNLPVPSPNEVDFPFNGAEARYCSADGSVIAGFLMDDYSSWPLLIWRKHSDGSYKYDLSYVQKYYEADKGMGKQFMRFQPTALSSNGEWVALITAPEFDAWAFEIPTLSGARLNLGNSSLEICPSETPIEFYAISNNGTAVGPMAEEGDMINRTGQIWKAGTSSAVSLDSFFHDETLAALSAVSPCFIAPDCSAVAGFAMDLEKGVVTFMMH